MIRSTALAIQLTRIWVSSYTRGLDPACRDERRAELESDLFEQAADSRQGTAASILLRCLLGVPADLSWRIEQADFGRTIGVIGVAILNRAEAGLRWLTRRGLPRLTMLIALLAVLVGVLLLVTAPASADRTPGESIAGGAVFLLAGAFMLAGLQAATAQPRAGALMVTLGLAPVALVFWATILVPVVAFAVSASAWAGARRSRTT